MIEIFSSSTVYKFNKSEAVAIIELIVANKTILNVLKLNILLLEIEHQSFYIILYCIRNVLFSVQHFCKICCKSLQIYFHPGMKWSKIIFVSLRVETESFTPGQNFTCDGALRNNCPNVWKSLGKVIDDTYFWKGWKSVVSPNYILMAALVVSQLTFACSKSTVETLEKGVKYVQS